MPTTGSTGAEAPRTGGATYIRGGKVVSSDDVSILEHLTHFGNLIVFFFASIVSTSPVRQQVDQFNGSRSRNYGGSSNVNDANSRRYQGSSNVNSLNHNGAAAGCTGGGG